LDTVKGYIERIIFRNNENGYTVLSIEDNGLSTVCVGSFGSIDAGTFMEFTGEYVFHPKFGQQFRVQTSRIVMPEDLDAIERYLGSGAVKGIGAVTARRIIEKFGEDSLRILDEEPERLAEIKGISRRKAQEIAASQEEKKDIRNVCIFLSEFGVSNAMAVKLFGIYDQEIYRIIRDNPYQLADQVSGIGFRKADEIARRSGLDPGSDFRIKACIVYTLQNALEQGHVYLPDILLKEKVLETLQPVTVDDICEIEDQDLERCITDLAVDSRIIIKEPDVSHVYDPQITFNGQYSGEETDNSMISLNSGKQVCTRQIYYSQNYYTELGIARMLVDLNLRANVAEEVLDRRIAGIEEKTGLILDNMQRMAVKRAADSGVLIITGGPGTGKTTTINALITYFEEENRKIVLSAPTGRAAKRMTEATGREAKTIHRMLELSADLEDTSSGARFNRDEDNPLEADVVIVDEVSMVDIFLMHALLRAVRPGTRLILVGDVNQLPSVGPGNILRDIIDSERFNTVKLEKIFRQAKGSEIVVNAHKINNGEHISLRTDSRDFIFLKRDNPQAVAGAVLSLIKNKLPEYVGADISEIQILSPMKRGSLGVASLNRFLQECLNPSGRGRKELSVRDQILREGDKIMHIKNNYDLEWEMRTETGFVYEKGTGIFNGDIGIIQRINEHTQMMEVLFDDDKHVIYEFAQLEEVTLAYAATIHKSQGSEYPAVILPLLSGPAVLMNRNILYTAVTRAKKCVVIVGNEDTVNRMIDNVREMERFTGLKDRLREVVGIS